MRYLFAIAIFASLSAAASETFTMNWKGNKLGIEIQKINGVRFSAFCAIKECLAQKAFNQRKAYSEKATKLRGNPASKYCSAQGGLGVILKDIKSRSYDFCLFKDKSMVDSWGFYEAR